MRIEEATWIAPGKICESPCFRGEFWVEETKGAQIDICGLGFFTLSINGKRVSSDVFVPAWSDYEAREDMRLLYPLRDRFSHRVYYLRYSVEEALVPGRNVIAVALGNGWYNQHVRNVEGTLSYGAPRLAFVLTAGDTVYSSGEEMRWSPGSITFSNVYYGEKEDLRLHEAGWEEPGFDDSAWEKAVRVAKPGGKLMLQDCPADKVIRTVEPRLVWARGNKAVYDAGENLSGWVELSACAESGARVTVRHAEELHEDQTLDYRSAGGEEQIQQDEYILDGKAHVLAPRFCWHAFRYFEVEGDARPLRCAVVHADVPVTGSFRCDDEAINWLFESFLRTQLANMHCGVPSDCPHRERLGYTGDGQWVGDAALLLLDSAAFYRKWMHDILDCQDVKTGHIQHTAPFYGGGGGPGGWGCAVVAVPYQLYRHTGDIDVLRESLPAMRRWLAYMKTRTQDGLIVREEEGGWCLGDWCTLGDVVIPEPLVNTYFYIKSMEQVKKICAVLGEDCGLEEDMERAKRALTENYFEEGTGSFCGGVQGADAFCLDCGLGDARTRDNLIARYDAMDVPDTGIFGTDIVIRLLFAYDQAPLACRLLKSSFAHQRGKGATTLWEHWLGGSHCHPMFGAVVRELFYGLLGIKQEEAGFKRVTLSPRIAEALGNVHAHLETASGPLDIKLRTSENTVYIDVKAGDAMEITLHWRGNKRNLIRGGESLILPLI